MERDLEYVYAVYQMGSFSKAAKFLFASQPTVSMAVQRVEDDLGYPVFDRQSHPLQLTAAGERFIQHVERVRESEKALRTEIDKIYRQEEEILRIGCSPLKSSYLMPEVIAKFHSLEAKKTAIPVLLCHPEYPGSGGLCFSPSRLFQTNLQPFEFSV